MNDGAQRLSPDRDLWARAEDAERAAQAIAFRDLLMGSAFHLVSNDGGKARGPRLSALGRVASSGFDGRVDKMSLDGTVTTASLGVDSAWKRWLTGLVMAYSEGEGSYTHADMVGGNLDSRLTSVHPYVAYTLNDRVRLGACSAGAAARCCNPRSAADSSLHCVPMCSGWV